MLVTYSREVRSLNQSQYAVVGIGTRVQTGGFEGARDFFLSPKTFRPCLGAHPPSCVMGTVVLSRVVKWLKLTIPVLPFILSWCEQGQLYFFLPV